MAIHLQRTNTADWLCPDLTEHWQLGAHPQTESVILHSTAHDRQLLFSATQGYALRYFNGTHTVAQVQADCQQQFGAEVSPTCVVELLQKLITCNVLTPTEVALSSPAAGLNLKAGVQWIEHPAGYWILRNPTDVTFLQVSERDRRLVAQLSQFSPTEIVQRYGVPPQDLQRLLHLLAATGMLAGTVPAKPPKPQKFNPLQLLFWRWPLCNPDSWLGQHVSKLHWLWTKPIAVVLTIFLIASLVVGLSVQSQIVITGQKLWATEGAIVLLPFILLCGLVVAIHELGHAFTLKHYGGVVPEIGLLVMCLMPGCYTNTTDSYCLVKRRQRLLVVGAGILCQFVLWAIGLWLWLLLTPGTWLQTSSYLLMAAALFTVAVNLNPLAKFDGYYLAVAATGINNLRSRSFAFYLNLVTGQPLRERTKDRIILALYAPFSLLYTLLIFGHLLGWLIEWCLTQIPALSLALLLLWVGYLFFPTAKSAKASP